MHRPQSAVFRLLVVLLAACASAPAFAQSSCDKVPENMRARCEEALRMRQACAGLSGDARTACLQRNAEYGALKENCNTLTGEAKARCLADNRTLDRASPCSGKSGAELEACLKAELTKSPR